MTFRERAALILTAAGALAVTAAAGAYGGWRAALAADGLLMLGGGVLLGLDSRPEQLPVEYLDRRDFLGELEDPQFERLA